ncbi:MAG TPA: molybdopterin molybdotransferase MoeA, partial [Candidatus Aquilonibacter sp.]|nr:molybdopterin molybdotransferase MoeA [Candidatus Aquilonibacter sp.]
MEQRGFVFQAENLLSPHDAIATFLARVSVAAPVVEHCALDDAFGRVLARDVVADRDYPAAPRSAMDGFAMHAGDAPGDLRVAGEIAMGAAWPAPLARGFAVRIPTGGIVPEGADAVVPIEDAELRDGSVHVPERISRGENVNERGCDMRDGELALAHATRLTAPHLGLLATLGMTRVPVFARPHIAVLSSGDELVPPDADPAIGQIRDSNRYAIAATLRAMGAEIV